MSNYVGLAAVSGLLEPGAPADALWRAAELIVGDPLFCNHRFDSFWVL